MNISLLVTFWSVPPGWSNRQNAPGFAQEVAETLFLPQRTCAAAQKAERCPKTTSPEIWRGGLGAAIPGPQKRDTLAAYGPMLGRPDVDTLKGSRYRNLKELRVQHQGRPLRILFAFDPRRCAYLILGGDKTGDDDWYVSAIHSAEAIYAQHLSEIGE